MKWYRLSESANSEDSGDRMALSLIWASVALVCATYFCLAAVAAKQDVGFDYLMLVRQWGPTFCQTTNCTSTPYNMFTLHGLWPNYYNGSYPANCAGPKLDTSTFPSSLLAQMNCNWVSYTGSSASFWSYEWNKHGTCALPLFGSQEAYFNATMSLNSAYDVAAALEKAGLDPADTSLPSTKVAEAFKSAWEVNAVVSCYSKNMLEVKLCIDVALQPMNCPSRILSSSCSSPNYGLPQDGQTESDACQLLSAAASPPAAGSSPSPGSGISPSPAPASSSDGGSKANATSAARPAAALPAAGLIASALAATVLLL